MFYSFVSLCWIWMGGFIWRPSKRPSSALILDPVIRRSRTKHNFVTCCNYYIRFLLILNIEIMLCCNVLLYTQSYFPLFLRLIRFVYSSQNSKRRFLCPKKYKTFYLCRDK